MFEDEDELKPRGILKFYEKVCKNCCGFRECYPEPKNPQFSAEIKLCIDCEKLYAGNIYL